MDYLEKGKALAKDGKHEEALEALALAYENDKENPDVHFFIGLCYSSLEEYEFAKYHYEIALRFDPKHEKTNLMLGGLNQYTSKKPPEDRLIRKARAGEQRAQKKVQSSQTSESSVPVHDLNPKLIKKQSSEQEMKWESAFPTDTLKVNNKIPIVQILIIVLLTLCVIGLTGYFVYAVFL
jgi:tetratricopeptide (TPR) repeat protein